MNKNIKNHRVLNHLSYDSGIQEWAEAAISSGADDSVSMFFEAHETGPWETWETPGGGGAGRGCSTGVRRLNGSFLRIFFFELFITVERDTAWAICRTCLVQNNSDVSQKEGEVIHVGRWILFAGC